MTPIWHQDNNSTRATVADISALLELNNIPFKTEPSTTIKNHTCFLVDFANKTKAGDLIMQEDGRFAKELQDLELNEEELAAFNAKEYENKAGERNRAARLKEEAEIIARIEAQLKDTTLDKKDDAEIATIDELIEREENAEV